ncbi:hypothetical protein [Streptomyces sp. NPDC051211]|uniref:hypothetical protein n=1 Tax=Streptomyces sp. NPDC051211 TaxID=3154643 RepID=UPI0034503D99
MGIKDQFQDKANELKEQAQKAKQAKQGTKDEVSERAKQTKGKKSQSPPESDPARQSWDDVDDNF